MGRNKEKYEYIELAILRDSPLLQSLLADAATSGRPAAQVAVQRLADYYRAGSPPGMVQASPVFHAPQSSSLASAQDRAITPESKDERMIAEYQAEQARANAVAALGALDAWE